MAPELDLIEVALAFSDDQAEMIALWRDKAQVDKVTDEQAAAWFADDKGLWTVVLPPWVLVQPESVQ